MKVEGSFDVNLAPQMDDDIQAGRMLIDKVYSGGMEGKGVGQMLSKRTDVANSAAYVAIEEFTGTIKGLEGGFTLMHVGLMHNGKDSLDVSIVPDSGMGAFKGVSGKLEIMVEQGKHTYVFEYSIPD